MLHANLACLPGIVNRCFCLFNLLLTLDFLGSNYPVLGCPRHFFPPACFLSGGIKEDNDKICKSNILATINNAE